MKIWNRQLGESISNITYHYLPALRWRNFRLFFGGQLLSMSGTFMTQQLTIPWLVYDLTKSAWLLGVAVLSKFVRGSGRRRPPQTLAPNGLIRAAIAWPIFPVPRINTVEFANSGSTNQLFRQVRWS